MKCSDEYSRNRVDTRLICQVRLLGEDAHTYLILRSKPWTSSVLLLSRRIICSWLLMTLWVTQTQACEVAPNELPQPFDRRTKPFMPELAAIDFAAPQQDVNRKKNSLWSTCVCFSSHSWTPSVLANSVLLLHNSFPHFLLYGFVYVAQTQHHPDDSVNLECDGKRIRLHGNGWTANVLLFCYASWFRK